MKKNILKTRGQSERVRDHASKEGDDMFFEALEGTNSKAEKDRVDILIGLIEKLVESE